MGLGFILFLFCAAGTAVIIAVSVATGELKPPWDQPTPSIGCEAGTGSCSPTTTIVEPGG